MKKQAHRDADGRPKGVPDHGLSPQWAGLTILKKIFTLTNIKSIYPSIHPSILHKTHKKDKTIKVIQAERFCDFVLNYCTVISSHFSPLQFSALCSPAEREPHREPLTFSTYWNWSLFSINIHAMSFTAITTSSRAHRGGFNSKCPIFNI